MINYEVSREALAPYVPEPLSPLAIRMLKDDQEPKYMVSLYLALCSMNDDPNYGRRADVFTYITDSQGRPGMLFLSVLCDIPPSIPKKYRAKFIEAQEQFFLDETGKCPIPHQEIEALTMTHEGVHLKMGDTLFDNDFVVSNSQIFHNGKNKTINYFNQEFISA